jgi:hypothetical protein
MKWWINVLVPEPPCFFSIDGQSQWSILRILFRTINSFSKMRTPLFLSVITFLLLPSSMLAQSKVEDKPFVVEYYYKAKWGYANEFIELFRKNHFPVLKKEMELGRITQITASSPVYHGTEGERWDYRVTIYWKNVQVANDGFDPETITKQLFTDHEKFKKEEQRRFEILLAHWDVPIKTVDLEK